MKVLITGERGFIGRHLWNKLEKEDYELQGYDLQDGYDLCDNEGMDTVFRSFRPDCVCSLAAQAYVPPGEKDPVQNAITNVAGTVNVLENAKKVGAAVVFTSSGAIYGNIQRIPVHEEVICRPESHYGISKLCAEEYAKFYYYKRDLPVTITRFSSVYGPGRKAGPINMMCEKAVKGEPVVIFGDGSVTRDMTYIDDVVEGLKLCIDGDIPCGDTYNIASGVQTSVKQIVDTIQSALSKTLTIEYEPEVPGDIKINYFDISKAQRYGYNPKVSLEEGIKKVIDHLKKEK